MNIKTDDICKKEFENLKYHKIDARYIVYHIANELIVLLPSLRLSTALARKNKPGIPSSTPSLTTNCVSACSTSSSRTKTI